MSRVYLALAVTLLMVWVPCACSQTCTSISSVGNWSNAASWSPAKPTASDDAVISSGADIIIDTAGCVCKTLTIGDTTPSGSAQITYNLNGTLTVGGTVQVGNGTCSGSLQMTPAGSTLTCDQLTTSGTGTNTFVQGSGTVTITGNVSFTLPSAFTSYNVLSITGGSAGAIKLGAATTSIGTLNISSGATLDVNGQILNVSGATTTINGTLIHSGNGSFQAVTVSSTGTINFTSAASSTVTFVGAVTVSSGGTWNDTAGALLVQFENGLTVNGTFTAANSSNYEFMTNTQSFVGTGSINNLSLGNLITLINSGSLTVGSVTGAGTLQQGIGSALTLSGAITSVTLDAATNPTNTVTYSGIGPQSVLALTYGNLNITGTTTLSSGTTGVGGTLTIAGGGSLDTVGFAINVTGTTTINGTLTYSGSGGGTTFTNTVAVNSGGVVDVTGSPTGVNFQQALTVAGTWNDTSAVGAPVQFDNNLTVSGAGSFTGGSSSNYTFAVNNQTFSGTATIPNLYVSTGIQLNNTGTLIVDTVDLLTGGLFINNSTLTVNFITATATSVSYTQGANSVLNVGGTINNFVLSGFSASAAGNTVNYNGTGSQTIYGVQYANLTISGARTGSCSITLDGTNTISISGNVNTTATFGTGGGYAIGGNLINLNGTTQQTFSGGSTLLSINNLQCSNPAGYLLNVGLAIDGNLTLGMGIINTGTNSVLLQGATTTVTGATASSYVFGSINKLFNAGSAQSFTFDVGDATTYAPVALSNINVSSISAIDVSTTAGNVGNISGSGIDPVKCVHRYWNLGTSGLSGPFDAVFNFAPADVTTGNPLAFAAAGFTGAGGWSSLTVGTRTATSTQVTGLNASGLIVQIGELAGGPPVITSPLTLAAAVGLPFTYAIVATGAPVSFNALAAAGPLPAGLTVNTTTGVISGTPSATGTFTILLSAKNAAGQTGTATLMLTIVPDNPPVPDSAGGAIYTGQPIVGQQLTFNGVATDPNGLPLTFNWDFGDGTTASGATVQHVYNTPGTFTINLTITDGALSATVPIPIVIFAPASGAAGVPNLATIESQPPIANPLNGISVQVTFSDGGIIGLTIDLDALIRSAFSVSTSFDGADGNVGTRSGLTPTIQFSNPGVFVATSSATDTGTNTLAGKARKTLAIGNEELGLPVEYTNDPSSRKIKTGKIGGKFAFSKSHAASTGASDTVSYSGSFELPEGLDLTGKPTFSFAIGNIVDAATVDSKGKGSAGTAGFIKKLQVKYPKLAKGSTVTNAGQTATFQVALSGVDLSGKGFDTEGITGSVLPSEKSAKSVPRSIQVAMVFAGAAYDATANVDFKLSSKGDSGAIGTRR
jgi:hypothetical protein